MLDYFVVDNPDPTRKDYLHLNSLGHRALAETTIAFMCVNQAVFLLVSLSLSARQKCLLERGRLVQPANHTLFPEGEISDIEVPRVCNPLPGSPK